MPPDGEGDTKRRLAVLCAQTERLNGVVSPLLDVSQLSDSLILVPSYFELVAVVRASIDSFGDAAAAAGSPVVLVSGGPVIGRWDRDRLEQVIQDLLTNALKFGAVSRSRFGFRWCPTGSR